MRRVVWIVMLVWAAWPQPSFAQSGQSDRSGPRQVIESADLRIRSILSIEAPEGSEASARRNDQLGDVVDDLLDIDRMARDALGDCWDRRSEEERAEYRLLLGQLVEQAYLRQVRSQITYQLDYATLSVERDHAWVETLLQVTSDPQGSTIQVVFVMYRSEGRWRVREIITDGVHLVGSYRVQFTRLIRFRGFDELLRRMRSRLQSSPSP